ncbi:hypothetical protein [Hyphomicrobium sp.]|uniref:hypothetical protein n=1 Tax=Hyphomicrobium sp. TaxID=82 RepID=UPI0025C596B9|nr:hypothetical protein [Hyphomicrobium sp.]
MGYSALNSQGRPQQAPASTIPPAAANGFGAKRPPTPTRTAVHDSEAARAVVFAVIRRIEGYLDEETLALDASPNFDLKASNDRKSQGLVDLNQAMRRLKISDVNEELERRLQSFRNKLAINLRKIRLHLDAVREITAMLSDALQSAESDGTYTRYTQRSMP